MNKQDKTVETENLGYPLIRKCVSLEVLQENLEEIIDYCYTLDEPLFVEHGGKFKVMLMPMRDGSPE